MTEREDIAVKRAQCQQAVRVLREALAALESLPTNLMSRINASGKYPVGDSGLQGDDMEPPKVRPCFVRHWINGCGFDRCLW